MGQRLSPEASPAPRQGVFFERDTAGLSNGRLQLESMLAVCAAHGRFLALPPPSRLAHLRCGLFHERRLWDMARLSSSVPIVFWGEEALPARLHRVETPLERTRQALLPSGEHWYFPREPSRISHFECLQYGSREAAETAAEAVLRSFELQSAHHEAARAALARLELRPRGYVAVHLRRGDFRAFRPAGFLGREALLERLAPLASGGAPLLIVTDAEAGDPDVLRARDSLSPASVRLSSEGFGASAPEGSLARAACDLLLCRWAADFVGTEDSTFSLGIMGMRLRDALLTGEDVRTAPRFLSARAPTRVCQAAPSWNKLTSFALCRAAAA
jgi:hypothetical protein